MIERHVTAEVAYEAFVVVPRVFSSADCDRIVAMGLAAGVEPAGLETGDEPTAEAALLDGSIRSSSVSWIARSESTEWIHTALDEVAAQANERYGFELTGIEEDLQFTVYDHPGAFYTWHQDGLDAGVSRRKLSLVVPLSASTEYSGGELEFFAVHDSVGDAAPPTDPGSGHPAPGRGDVVAFPAFEYHRVSPVRSGTRYSLVAWVGGPPFR